MTQGNRILGIFQAKVGQKLKIQFLVGEILFLVGLKEMMKMRMRDIRAVNPILNLLIEWQRREG